MIYELIYTDWNRGVRPKDANPGYCTVAYTRGMPANLVNRAERFAGYCYPKGDTAPPCSIGYFVTTFGAQTYAVFCRVAPIVRSGRAVYIAHVVMCLTSEIPKGTTPIDIVASRSFFRDDWNQEPDLLQSHASLPVITPASAGKPAYWRDLAGDAGWAGRLQQLVKEDANARVAIIVPADADVLRLIREASAIVSPDRSWDATFNTYYNISVSTDTRCSWRFCLTGSDIIHDLRRDRKIVFIDLTSGPLPAVSPVTPLIEAARAGTRYVESGLLSRSPFPSASALHPTDEDLMGKGGDKAALPADLKSRSSNKSSQQTENTRKPASGPARNKTQMLLLPFVFVAVLTVIASIFIVKRILPPKASPDTIGALSSLQSSPPTNAESIDPFMALDRVKEAVPHEPGPSKSDSEMVSAQAGTSEITQISNQGKANEPPPPVTNSPPPVPPPVSPPVTTAKTQQGTDLKLIGICESIKIDLPRQINIGSGEITFYSLEGIPLKAQSGSLGGADGYSLGSDYQSLRVKAGIQLVFGGGLGTKLPFLIELAADSKTPKQLFVIGPCTNFSATLGAASKDLTVQLERPKNTQALKHLAEVATNITWMAQLQGAEDFVPCGKPVFSGDALTFGAPELFKRHEKLMAKRSEQAKAMKARPVDEKKADETIRNFINSLSAEALAGSALEPLRAQVKSLLEKKIKELNFAPARNSNKVLSRETLERNRDEAEKRIESLENEMNSLKLNDSVLKWLKARELATNLRQAQQELEKARADFEKARASFEKAWHKKKEKESPTREQIEHKKGRDSAHKLLKDAEGPFEVASTNCATCVEDEKKLLSSSSFTKEYVRKEKMFIETEKEHKEIMKRLADLDQGTGERQKLIEKRDLLLWFVKALENGTSPEEVRLLLTDPKQLGDEAELSKDIRKNIHGFFNDDKVDDEWIDKLIQEPLKVSRVSVFSDGKLLAVIAIGEIKRVKSSSSHF